jgi:hypothetical protein
MRFTLGKMFIAIAMLALACAGMMYRSSPWVNGIFTLSLLLFVVPLIQIVRLSTRGRIAAVAFAAVGITYLVLATATIFRGPRELLFTNNILAETVKVLRIENQELTVQPPPTTTAIPDPTTGIYPSLTASDLPSDQFIGLALSAEEDHLPLYYFFVIGHCVFSWLFAVLAAWFAGRMYDRREQTRKKAT